MSNIAGPPKNGQRLNSGPPRLRIDNVINRRHGTSADEELEAEAEAFGSSAERRIPNPPQLDLRHRNRPTRDEEQDVESSAVSDGVSEDIKRAGN